MNMISQISLRTRSVPNVLTRRGLHMTKMTRSEGATAGAKTGLSEKEMAEEGRWARSHDADLLKQLREKLAKQEKDTDDLKKKLAEIEKNSSSKKQ